MRLRDVRQLKALVILIIGVSLAVCAVTGYALQASPTSAFGWDIAPLDDVVQRLSLGAGALLFVSVGLLLVYRFQ